MKIYTLLLATALLVISFTTNAQDSIPNSGFEQWNSYTSPNQWNSVNSLLPPGISACFQTNASHSGGYAVQLKTIDLNDIPVPGVLSLGEVGMGFTSGGIAFDSKPIALKGYFMHPTSGDEVMIGIEFFKNGNIIGGGLFTTSDSIAEYTQFEAPISFQTSELPDTMNITIVTDQYTIGSSILLDDLVFEYPTTSVSETGRNPINAYPNPCSDQLFMSTSSDLPLEVRMIDLQGRQVLRASVNDGKINTSSLQEGVYTLIVDNGQRITRQKIIKR